MMKNLHSAFLLCAMLLPLSMMAQITITNATFPKAGDTLTTITTTNIGSFDKNFVGENVEWDLRDIGEGTMTQTIYSKPTAGESNEIFPTADLLDNTTAQEIYYKSYNNKIVELGRAGLDPVLNAIDIAVQNEGEPLLRRAPMTYNDLFNESSSFMIAGPSSIIPDSILGALGSSVDSLRLAVDTNIEDYVDSWGTARLPNADYDVVRVKRKTINDVKLEAKVIVLGWVTVDPTNPLFSQLGDVLNLLGESTTYSYRFLSNDHKEIIADFQEDREGNIIIATYKGDISTSSEDIDPKQVDVLTYPNPTFGDVTFRLQNMPKDEYKVELYNILGKRLWSSKIDYFSGSLSADLSFLRKGTYIYSILDGSGRKITTKRLMVITP